jgi:hypothetical protein
VITGDFEIWGWTRGKKLWMVGDEVLCSKQSLDVIAVTSIMEGSLNNHIAILRLRRKETWYCCCSLDVFYTITWKEATSGKLLKKESFPTIDHTLMPE